MEETKKWLQEFKGIVRLEAHLTTDVSVLKRELIKRIDKYIDEIESTQQPPAIVEDLEGEEWKDIVGFEGLYKISNYGRVFMVKKGRMKTVSTKHNPSGSKTMLTSLYRKGGTRETIQIHRAVYMHFKGAIMGMIEFIDGDYTNCRIDNLVSVTSTRKFRETHCSKT